ACLARSDRSGPARPRSAPASRARRRSAGAGARTRGSSRSRCRRDRRSTPGSARSLAVRFRGCWLGLGRVEVDPLLVEVDGPAAVAERREPEHAVEPKAVDGRVLVKEAPGGVEILAGE